MIAPIHTTSEILDRVPPSNVEAEIQVLGSILIAQDPSRCLEDVSGLLSPGDFYAEQNAVIYTQLLEMGRAGIPIDVSILLNRLRQAGVLEKAGGAAHLGEIASAVAVSVHAKHYAGTVLRESRKRKLVVTAEQLLRQAWRPDAEPEACLAEAEKSLAAIKTGGYGCDPVTLFDAVITASNQIEAIATGKTRPGCMTGLIAFDERLGGFHAGELIVLAARPGQGKTSLALQMAAHMARVGRSVYFASLEMGHDELALKLLCSEAGVSTQRIRSGSLTDVESQRLAEASQRIASKRLHLHDWPSIRPFDIGRAARRLKCDVAIVDYLQIVTPPDDRKKRYEQVGDISRDLKRLAREMRIPVIACAQIGRQADQSKENRPRLSQLRESGNIENDADQVLLLWRPEGGIGKDNDCWDAELEVAKNRHGPNARIRLDWDGPKTRFICHEATETWK